MLPFKGASKGIVCGEILLSEDAHTVTINHGLGAIPTFALIVGEQLEGSWAMALVQIIQPSYAEGESVCGSLRCSTVTSNITEPLTIVEGNYSKYYSADEEAITFTGYEYGSSKTPCNFKSSKTYRWIARA